MTTLVKLAMILLTITSFSCGLVNLMVIFVLPNPQAHAMLGITSLIISWAINQEIIDDDDKKISEYDETF
jgi:hypothetical protein